MLYFTAQTKIILYQKKKNPLKIKDCVQNYVPFVNDDNKNICINYIYIEC